MSLTLARKTFVALTLAVLILQTGPTLSVAHADDDKPKRVKIKHDSPQSVFKSMLRATQAADFQGVARTLAPSTQQEMGKGMIGIAATAAFNPQVDQAKIMAVLTAHGLTSADLPRMGPNMEAQALAALKKIADLPAFIGDMMDSLPGFVNAIKLSKAANTQNAIDRVKFEQLKIKGDIASAKVTVDGQAVTEEKKSMVYFTRVDKKWYVSPKSKK